MVAQPSYKQSNEFERSVNALEQYYIVRTFLYLPLFNSLVKIPQPTRRIIGGSNRLCDIALRNQTPQNQRLVQRFTNVNLGLQAQETYDQGTRTQKIVTSIETKEDNLRKKLDEGLQNIDNQLSALYEQIIGWFSELDLDDFLTKFNEIHRIIKLFDGTEETDFFPKFNKIHDTVKDLKTKLTTFQTDAIEKLNTLSGSLEKVGEDITNGFFMVAEIFKQLNDFVTNFTKNIKPKVININTKINSLSDAATTLKTELDKV